MVERDNVWFSVDAGFCHMTVAAGSSNMDASLGAKQGIH